MLISDFIFGYLGEWEYFIRIVVACICGACIGFERSRRQKEAGIRTHIILALGSALAMVVSKYGFFDMVGTGIDADASRIASNILTGIGFLGAGVIFVRSGSIKGLTTAAGIWATAGIGLTVGAGMYEIGICSAVLLVFIQVVLHKFLPASESVTSLDVSVTIKDTPESIEKVRKFFDNKNVYIQGMHLRKNSDGTLLVNLHVRSPHDTSFNEVVKTLHENDDVFDISIT